MSQDMSQELRNKCINHTRKRIKECITKDQYIIQLVSHIEDLDSVINKLAKRLRDWYELCLPEISRKIQDHETFVRVIEDSKPKLMQKNKIQESMGQDFTDLELRPLHNLRKEILNVFKLRGIQLDELEILMQKEYPNLVCLAGSLIGAKLIKLAGSMKKLVGFPASTLQLLGAEKALFRHLIKGSKPPKYGILLSHPYVAESKDKSKAARRLADKISIAAKIDYFKGEFLGDKLKEQLK